MDLLETAAMLQKEGGGQLDAWLESLTLEERKELWVQWAEVVMDLLDSLVEVLPFVIEEE